MVLMVVMHQWLLMHPGIRPLFKRLASRKQQPIKYAVHSRQAHIFEALHEHFTGIWSGLELPREHLTDQIYPICLDSDLMELDGDDV